MSRPSARRRWSRSCDQRGITLLEVVVSSAIFAIGVIGMARLTVMASESDGQARRMAEATAVANDLLHYLTHVPFDQVTFLTPVNATYADFLDENPSSTVFRGTNAPETTDYDYSCSDLPDLAVDAGVDAPCIGDICVPFPGLTAGALDPSRPSMEERYERYWRLQEFTVDTPRGPGRALGIAVIVRWRDVGSRSHRRVVIFGTRFFPEDILP